MLHLIMWQSQPLHPIFNEDMNSMMLKHLIEAIHKMESPVNLNFSSIFENLYTGLARSYVFCFLASHGSAKL